MTDFPNAPQRPLTATIKGLLTDFETPKVMGILNITPDSFYEGSRKQSEKEIADRVIQIMEEEADLIDAGGYSSRPAAAFVDETEELRRLRFGLNILFREAPNATVSVDTFRANVACRCVEEYGAAIINDISAGNLDPAMIETAARLNVPYIAMHMKGNPQTMMEHTNYDDVVRDVILYFAQTVNRLHQAGVNDVWIDPGFGFSKTTARNYELLASLDAFHIFNLPLVVGFSRKTMIREALGITTGESLNATTALNMLALTKGAHILRVHDVKEAVQTVKLYKQTTNIQTND